MNAKTCPKCQSKTIIKSGWISDKQRYKCKSCNYYFTVDKVGKQVDPYYVIKALQLYLEGVSYREIERILQVSHVSVMNWVKQYKVKRPFDLNYKPNYKVLKTEEMITLLKNNSNKPNYAYLLSPVGDKFMVIQWDRFKE